MSEKNLARSWMGGIFALAGLVVSFPVSYFFQSSMNRAMMDIGGVSIGDYIVHIPGLFGQVDRHDTMTIEMRNTVVWTAIIFLIAGFGLGLLIKLIIKAAQQPAAATKQS